MSDDLRAINDALIERLMVAIEGAFYEGVKSPMLRMEVCDRMIGKFDFSQKPSMSRLPVRSPEVVNIFYQMARDLGGDLKSYNLNLTYENATKTRFSLHFMAECIDFYTRSITFIKRDIPSSNDVIESGVSIFDDFMRHQIDDVSELHIPNQATCRRIIQNKLDLISESYRVYQEVAQALSENNRGFIIELTRQFAPSTQSHISEEDLFQEASFLIYRKLLKYDHERGNFLTFLKTIVTNHFIGKAKKAQTESKYKNKDFLMIDEADDCSPASSIGLDKAAISKSLSQLDPCYSKILMLRFGDEGRKLTPLKQIASKIGVSVTQLREKLLPEAIDSLKKELSVI